MSKTENAAEQKARRQFQQEAHEKLRVAEHRRRLFKGAAIAGFLVLAVSGAAYGFLMLQKQYPFDAAKECVTHARLAMHIHPQLSIRINGQFQDIPADVGIPGHNCMRPVHTHDRSGTLHVEWTSPRDFTLGDFFRIWGRPFSSERIFDHAANASHEIVMTVNGRVNTDYEKLVLRDNDRILIDYRRR